METASRFWIEKDAGRKQRCICMESKKFRDLVIFILISLLSMKMSLNIKRAKNKNFNERNTVVICHIGQYVVSICK